MLTLEFLRLAGISGLIFTAFLLIAGMVMGYLYQDKIKLLLIKSLNDNLKTEIFIADIKLEIFRSFPLASLNLSTVTIMGAGTTNPKDTLLNAQKIQLQFRLTDLLKKRYIVTQITVNHGFLHPEIDLQGKSNYELWDSHATSQEHDFQIELQRIILNRMHIRFTDQRYNHLIIANTSKATIGGSFSKGIIALNLHADIPVSSLSVNGDTLFYGLPLTMKLDFSSTNQSVFYFSKSQININNHKFTLDGRFDIKESVTDMDVSIEGKKLSLGDFIKDIPVRWKQSFSGYEARGELDFFAKISGQYSDNITPHINVSFQMKRGSFIQHNSNLKIRELNLTGAYSNGSLASNQTTIIRIDQCNGKINSGHFRGNGSIENLDQPLLKLQFFADLLAPDLTNLLQLDTVTAATGRISADIAFRGSMSDKRRFTGQDLVAASASGSITLNNVGFDIKNDPLKYRLFNGSLVFSNNDLMVESFTGHAGNSDFAISGFFRRVLPYLFLKDESIQIDATLQAGTLDFDELLQANVSEADTLYSLRLSNKLDFNLDTRIEKIKFRRFEARHVSGTASMQKKRFFAQDVRFEAMNGIINASGYIDGTHNDRLIVGCGAVFQRVDIHQLFYQMGNFGQSGIIDENIFGIMNADLQFNAVWSPSLVVNWESLRAIANIKIEDGVLMNYEPMKALGRYIRVDDLNRVNFSTLENIISIRDKKISIPDMQIQSNVLNLKLAGTHDFDNQIEYYLQVLLSDILSRKNKQQRNPQEQYGHIMDDGLGRTTLFLKVDGHIDSPVFRYDGQAVRQKISDDFRQHTISLRDALRKEFNITPDTTGITDKKTRTLRRQEMERIRKQQEGKMVIEWEDL